MTRFLILAFYLCFCSLCYAQDMKIQDTFFGHRFGSRMYHMNDVFKSKGRLLETKEDRVIGYDLSLGGIEWKFIECEYYNDQFFSIQLSINYKTNETAQESYLFLKDKLKRRYGTPKISIRDTGEESYWSDAENSSMLYVYKGESKGGEIYYYLNLMYWNIDLSEEKYNESNSEL